MLLGRYEPAVVSEILTAGPIKVAYDVGAHFGFMSLALSKLVGKTRTASAFEPIPDNAAVIASTELRFSGFLDAYEALRSLVIRKWHQRMN